jgi:hypothetical protein
MSEVEIDVPFGELTEEQIGKICAYAKAHNEE